MLIEISGPVFKCEADENIFFSRLYAVPGFNGVIAKGPDWYLTLAENPEESVIAELQDICNVWGTTFKVLG